MTERPDPRPEGKLIMAALDASPLSQRKAAKHAGISESRWRQIVSGYQSIDGIKHAVRGPDRTLARMAQAVQVTPEALAEAGRPEAAALLRDLEAERRRADERAARAAAAAVDSASPARVEERWFLLEAVLRNAPVGLDPAERRELRDRLDRCLAESTDWQPTHTA